MTEISERPIAAADAESVEEQAAVWFRRRNFFAWQEEDQTALELWLAQSPSHEIAYWRLLGAWSRTERLSALHRPATVSAASSSKSLPFVKRAVAGFAIASILGAAGWTYFSQPGERSFQTPTGGRQVLTFADGTKVELNTDTVLRARIDSKHRSAELVRGEAYFKVHHDARNPFVVTVSRHRIVDLGTEFSVRAGEGQVRVSLVEGRARVETENGAEHQHSVDLTPGDVATANATSMSVSRKSAVELSNDVAWRRGLLVFKYAPLREAVAEINRYNNEKLVIADASVANRTIYGTIPTRDVQAFVRVTTGALGLHVEKRGTEFVISR